MRASSFMQENFSRSYRKFLDIESEQDSRPARRATWPATGLRKFFFFFFLRSDRTRDRLGAGQPRRRDTLRHRLLGRPRDLEKISLFFFLRSDRSAATALLPRCYRALLPRCYRAATEALLPSCRAVEVDLSESRHRPSAVSTRRLETRRHRLLGRPRHLEKF